MKSKPEPLNRVFLTSTADSGDGEELTDEQIEEMMQGETVAKSCTEMLAELEELSTKIHSEGEEIGNLQTKVAEMKSSLDANTQKTKEIEGFVIGMVSEVEEDDRDEDTGSRTNLRSVTLPEIRRNVRTEQGSEDDDEPTLS